MARKAVDVWCCVPCWGELDDREPKLINMGRGHDYRCYCCGAPLLTQATATTAVVETETLDYRAKVWA